MTITINKTVPTFYPSLRYRDAPNAIAWLVKAFDFKEHLVVPGPDGTVAHAELSFGNGVFMLGSAPAGPGPADATEPAMDREGIYAYVEDVDGHHARALAAGAEVSRALEDTEYGARMYTVRDIEGNPWTFGNYSVAL